MNRTDLDKEAQARGYKHRQVQFGTDMYVPLMNLDLLAHQLRSSDNMLNVSILYEKLVSGLDRVVEQRDEANAYLMDMQKLIK